EGIKISNVATSKLRRYASLLNVVDFFKFFFGLFQALLKLLFFMPDVVFSKGGPGAFAIVLAARWYRIPVVVHESDAVAGLTNRKSAKHAAIIDLAFEEAKKYFPSSKPMHVVGVPVRKDLLLQESPDTSRLEFGFHSKEKPTLFVVGGSQGAQVLNNFVLDNAQLLLSNFHVIHSVGPNNYEEFKAEFDFMTKNYDQALKDSYWSTAYMKDRQMAVALNGADLVISRAGSSIWELAGIGKPAILIPLPDSANNHQRENAYAYANIGAALVIEEENFKPNLFVVQVQKLLSDPEKLERMKLAARTFYKAESAELIAQDLLNASSVVNYLAAAEG
ncbi:MAG: UDP-N-acetylglucosamine--N-acetylmuramyl-(pentapeptide) pyrophosphoryl-undecaprenol N-acetylglucosamine transferase, partial [Candidatus Harrisonbacteria bacterium]|nr:UDP-N-acetylglucosamine--N-acetylmuramyl-(pentapeptide) pyrophosphoryl-undecaprenol N-acetylglucosamine transferase [Candidatus Harrisonbacteria bacterium]